MTELRIDTKVRLNNGIEMPLFGLGTWQLKAGAETEQAVLQALEAGYRLIDTAASYMNEKDVGKALEDSGIPRKEVFITTKLWNQNQGLDTTIKACERSLKLLRVSDVDLYLIHWPVEGIRSDTWRAFETLLEEGKCRAIGVSNYTIRHLEELLEDSSTIPAVNQVEFSPYLYQRELLDFCRSHDIQLEAYSPLTRGQMLDDPKLAEIGLNYSKTPAQILLRWALQHKTVAIPRSASRERIRENADIFDFSISEDDMNSLDSFNSDMHFCWDPSDVP